MITLQAGLVKDRSGFERILFAVNDSKESLAAIPFVASLAAASDALVLVLHVWSPDESALGQSPRGLSVIEMEELLEHVLGQLRAGRVHAVGESPTALLDRVPDLIQGRADSFRADLVVVGNRGLSELHSIFAASRTHQLVSMSNRPVLAVGSEARRWIGKPRRVLAVLDDGDDGGSVVRAAIDVAAPASARVDVIHFCAGSESRLDILAEQLKGSGVFPSWTRGDAQRDPVGQIVHVAIRTESDLVVIASDRTSVDSLLPGDVMHRLLGSAPCAVLVVPPSAGQTSGRRLHSSVDVLEQRSA